MARRGRYEEADKYLARKRRQRAWGLVAIILVGTATALLVAYALMGNP